MADGALLKLARAAEHINALETELRERNPFRYVVATNTATGERWMCAKRNSLKVDQLSVIAGDAAYAIRSSLDHAYWEIVSPYAVNEGQRKAIQFPFSRTKNRLKDAVQNRLAQMVSDRFLSALIDLAPHPEIGGNRDLYLIEQMNAVDKHRHLTPLADYRILRREILVPQVPDFPAGIEDVSVSGSRIDVIWRSRQIRNDWLGDVVPPSLHLFEKTLNVPMEVVYQVSDPDLVEPLVPTLRRLIDVATDAISKMRAAALEL